MKKRKILIPLIIITIFVLFFVTCGNLRPSVQKQLDIIKGKIPAAVQFTEENEDSLNTLLEIQNKLYTNNAHIEAKYEILIIDEELVFRNYGSSKRYPVPDEETFITKSEKVMVKELLLNTTMDDGYRVILISAEKIEILYASHIWADLYIRSPAEDLDNTNEDGSLPMLYEYAEKISDDWCTYIFMNTAPG